MHACTCTYLKQGRNEIASLHQMVATSTAISLIATLERPSGLTSTSSALLARKIRYLRMHADPHSIDAMAARHEEQVTS